MTQRQHLGDLDKVIRLKLAQGKKNGHKNISQLQKTLIIIQFNQLNNEKATF